jgi:hypothetical protein
MAILAAITATNNAKESFKRVIFKLSPLILTSPFQNLADPSKTGPAFSTTCSRGKLRFMPSHQNDGSFA